MDNFAVNLTVVSDDKAAVQNFLNVVNKLSNERLEVLYSGDVAGDYADCFQKHLKAKAAFLAVARKKEEQSVFNFGATSEKK